VGGLGPGAMVGAFEVVVAHLGLDTRGKARSRRGGGGQPGSRRRPARWPWRAGQGETTARVMVWRRTIRRVLVNDSWSGSRSWATAVSCMRPAGRRGPAGAPRPPGGRRRGLGAPHRPRAALVDLEFVQGGLDRPALVVQASQLDRGSGLGVQGRGDEPVQDRLAAGGGAAVGAVPAARLAALVVQASSSTPTRTGSPFPAVSRASQDPSARTRSAANPARSGRS
jgi:hypothetical protein